MCSFVQVSNVKNRAINLWWKDEWVALHCLCCTFANGCMIIIIEKKEGMVNELSFVFARAFTRGNLKFY